MEFKDFVPILVQIVLIPLLTALTGVAVKWINSKANSIKAKTNNEYAKLCIDTLNDMITTTVVAVNQTYVDELKKDNTFTKEAQMEAFTKVYNTVMNNLTEQVKETLTNTIGDIESYVTNKIEETVTSIKITEQE